MPGSKCEKLIPCETHNVPVTVNKSLIYTLSLFGNFCEPDYFFNFRFATDPNGINDMKRWARINKQSQQDCAMDR